MRMRIFVVRTSVRACVMKYTSSYKHIRRTAGWFLSLFAARGNSDVQMLVFLAVRKFSFLFACDPRRRTFDGRQNA